MMRSTDIHIDNCSFLDNHKVDCGIFPVPSICMPVCYAVLIDFSSKVIFYYTILQCSGLCSQDGKEYVTRSTELGFKQFMEGLSN